jgi:hypothetical protein
MDFPVLTLNVSTLVPKAKNLSYHAPEKAQKLTKRAMNVHSALMAHSIASISKIVAPKPVAMVMSALNNKVPGQKKAGENARFF